MESRGLTEGRRPPRAVARLTADSGSEKTHSQRSWRVGGGGNSRSRDARRQACANLLEFAAETSLPLGVSHVPIPGDVQAIAPHHLTSDLASFSDVSAANPRGVTSRPLHQQLPLRLQSPLHYTQRLRKRDVRSGESAKMTIGGCKQKQERMRSLTCK